MRPDLRRSGLRNRLLAALPLEDFAQLQGALQAVDLPIQTGLHAPRESSAALFLIEGGWVSMLVMLEDGDVSEVELIGREGMAGMPLLLKAEESPLEGLMQAGGRAAEPFRHALHIWSFLRGLLLPYCQTSSPR